MLNTPALHLLDAWCHRRALHWTALGVQPAGGIAMLLEPDAARRPWARLRLCIQPDGFRLDDELGETLAEASDLPALLDAVDGGVAECLG